MLEDPIVIVDIETTGLSARKNRIIEFAAIRLEHKKVVREFSTLMNPGVKIDTHISRLTGISNNDLVNQPYFDEVSEEIYTIFKDAHFMAHNVLFDFSFIKHQLEACGYIFTPRLLCSVKLSRALYPNARGHSLEKIINRHQLPAANRHRAYDDAKAIYEFLKVTEREKGEEAVASALKKQLRLKSLPSNFDETYLNGIKNTPGVYIFENAENIPVYIGKSTMLRNRILSHFNMSTTLDKEMKISQNTHKLKIIETGSELEALLLESRLVKEKLPIYNRQLRRKRKQTVILKEFTSDGYATVRIVDCELSEFKSPDQIFGVYNTRGAAKNALLSARNEHGLCSKLLGLEQSKQACFYHQLGKCKGACAKKEPPSQYNIRFEMAFKKSRIASWKYKKPIVIRLNDSKGLLVDHWIIKGTVEILPDSEPEITKKDYGFDYDTYKILKNHLRKHQSQVVPV